MWPLILEALGMGAEGAIAAEGAGALAAGEAATVTAAPVLGESAVASESTLMKGMNNAPSYLPKESEASKKTMDRIIDLTSGDGKNKHIANDDEHMFAGGAHLTADNKNSHIMKMFAGGHGGAANDNDVETKIEEKIDQEEKHDATDVVKDSPETNAIEKLQVTTEAIVPLVESIDRNTRQTELQLEELNAKISEFLNKETIEELKVKQTEHNSQSEAKAEQSSYTASKSVSNTASKKEEPSAASRLGGVLGGLGKILGGGLTMGLGHLITGNDKPDTHDHGGYSGSSNDNSPIRTPNVLPDMTNANFADYKEGIKAKESRHLGDYDAIAYNVNKHGKISNSAGVYAPKQLSTMTLGEVFDFQRNQMKPKTMHRRGPKDPGSTGVGAYQFESMTLKHNAEKVYGKNSWRDKKFTAETQDRLAKNLFDERKGLNHGTGLYKQWALFTENAARKGVRDGLREKDLKTMGNQAKTQQASQSGGSGKVDPSSIKPPMGKGQLVNTESKRQTVVNNNTVNVNSSSNTQPKQTDKRRTPPPADPTGFMDKWAKYFGLE